MIAVSRTLDQPPPYTRAAPPYSSVTSSAASSLFSADSFDNDVYQYGSKNTTLRFSQHKRTGIRLPAYGCGSIVDGEIFLRSTAHIENVTVSLRGEIKTVIESSSRPTVTLKSMLLDQTCSIWPIPDQTNTPIPHTIPFSFPFPTSTKERRGSLPPSFAAALTEGTIRVKYTIVAHVRRTGWRGNTTIETEIFYLPRPIEAMPPHIMPSSEAIATPNESPDDMRIMELPVKQSIAGKQISSGVKVHVAYPLAVRLSRGCSTQFSIFLSSSTQPAESLLQVVPHISVRMVRTVTLIARGLSTTEETICAHGILHTPESRDKAEGQALVSISGLVQLPSTTWTAWEVEGVSKITYGLRITLPTSFRPEYAYFDLTVPVLGLSGSYGSSSSPDLSLVPTPAALLKKPIGYMPMRV